VLILISSRYSISFSSYSCSFNSFSFYSSNSFYFSLSYEVILEPSSPVFSSYGLDSSKPTTSGIIFKLVASGFSFYTGLESSTSLWIPV